TLQPGCEIHRAAEIVETFVQVDHDTASGMNTDLQHDGSLDRAAFARGLGPVLGIEGIDAVMDVQRSLHGLLGSGKGRHYRIADGFHQRTIVTADGCSKEAEMPP